MSNTSSSSSGERAMQRRSAVEILFPSEAEAAADFVDDGVSIPRVSATASATVAPSAGSVHQGAAHDEAIGASQGLSGHNLPMVTAAHARNLWTTSEFPTRKRTSRKRPRVPEPTINEEEILEDGEESESEEMQKNGEDGSGPSSSFGTENAFQVDEDLL
uniref:Uncharacterized protein n=1 Tax=Zea mays TaxID=4577 RepID=A0A804PU90_MAIZE